MIAEGGRHRYGPARYERRAEAQHGRAQLELDRDAVRERERGQQAGACAEVEVRGQPGVVAGRAGAADAEPGAATEHAVDRQAMLVALEHVGGILEVHGAPGGGVVNPSSRLAHGYRSGIPVAAPVRT